MKQRILLISFISLLAMLGFVISNANATGGIAAYYINPGGSYEVALDGQLKTIINNTAYTIFIPARTLTEQQSFINNLPAGVIVDLPLTWSGSTKTEGACHTIGGTVYDSGVTGTFCRYLGSTPPAGWIQAASWQKYATSTWGGDYCGRWKTSGPSVFSNVTSKGYQPGGGAGCHQWATCNRVDDHWATGTQASDGWCIRNVVNGPVNPSTNRVEMGIY